MRNLFLGFSSCGLIVVSLDGLSSESHNKLRGKGQFRKTASNLVWLIKQRRAKKLNFEIHVTFVINKLNLHEAARAVVRLERLGVDEINFNHLQPSGRAKLFEKQILPDDKELIEVTAQVVACWVLSQKINISFHIPPALAYYMERRWGITSKVSNPVACGVRIIATVMSTC
jgi:MoaA/NifB/PqqE/SkfB family radical SAM enzyme